MAKPIGSSNPWRGGSGGGFMVAQKRTSCLGCDPNCCPDRDQTSEEFRHLLRGRKKNSNTRPVKPRSGFQQLHVSCVSMHEKQTMQ